MEITKIKVYHLSDPKPAFENPNDNVIAYASATFDDVFMIHSIKIVKTSDDKINMEFFKQRLKDGSLKDIMHPVDKDFRVKLYNAIMGELEK